MEPILLWEILDTILSGRAYESQSIDTRPHADGYFFTIDMEETAPVANSKLKGPRTCTVAVHHNAEIDRDYGPITRLLNLVDLAFQQIDDDKGSDGIRVSQVRRQGRSGNLLDEGWNTITRTATYGVSYDEYAV